MNIIYEPAECAANCTVPDCHYLHSAGWWVGLVSFQTEAEAQEYLAELQATERQLSAGLDTLTNPSP